MSSASLLDRRRSSLVEDRPEFYAVGPASAEESVIGALFSAVIAQRQEAATVGYELVRQVVGRQSVDHLTSRDVVAMMSVGESRVAEYLDDDDDLLLEDD